jgi:hypothetical protein
MSRGVNCWGCQDGKDKKKPNGRKEQCQCVMCHSCMTNEAIEQCRQTRSKESNLFCDHCEQLHGKYYRAKYGGSK